MIVVTPVEVTEARLQSTTVANEYSDWSAGTYNEDDSVVFDRKVYTAVTTTSDQPDVGSVKEIPTWVDVGWSNKWRMFTEGQDSQSSATGSIEVSIDYGRTVTTLAVLGASGSEVTVTMTDPSAGIVYNEIMDIVDTEVLDIWEFYYLEYDEKDSVIFEDMPPYPLATVDVSIEGELVTDEVLCGQLVAGVDRDIGYLQEGVSIDIVDYSTKERDGFGNLTLVAGRVIKTVDFPIYMKTSQLASVLRILKKISSTPALYIGESEEETTIVYGIQTDISPTLEYTDVTFMSLVVEEF